jgi:hypothetical protein
MRGDTEPLSNWAGQSVGLVTHVQGAGAIVDEIVSDAERILTELA